LTAERRATSKIFRKVTFEYPEGVLGPSESESMSTPSATACFAKQQLKSIPTKKQMETKKNKNYFD
jgi:hypothetical protein